MHPQTRPWRGILCSDRQDASGERYWLWLLPLLGFAAVFFWCNVTSFDLGWHLKTGEWIAANRAVPHADPFSFTAAGRPWIAHEWLFGLLAFFVHSVGGVVAITASKSLLAVSACALAAWAARVRGASPGLIVVVLAACLAVGWQRFTMRPELVSLPIAVAFVLVAEAGRERRRLLLLLPVLELAWTNIHSGTALLGWVLAGVYLLDRWWEGRSSKERPGLAWNGGAFLGVVAASVANPSGMRGLLYGLVRAESPLSNREFESVAVRFSLSPDFSFWVFAAFTIAAAALLALRSRKARPSDWILLVGLFVLSCVYFRFRSLFVFLLAPTLASYLSGSALFGRLRNWVPAVTAAGILAGLAGMAAGSYSYRFGADLHSGMLPAGAADFVTESGLTGRVFNTYGFGGTLLWKGPAGQKIFIDGREDVYVGPGVIREYLDAVKYGERWRAVVDKYDLDYAVVDYPEQPPRSLDQSPEVTHFARDRWALVYCDDVAVIYVRRNGRNDAVIRQHELRWIQPQQLSGYLDRVVRDPAQLSGFESEVSGLARLHPDSFRLHFLLGVLAVKRGPLHLPQAAEEFRRVLELNPEYVPARRNLAAIQSRLTGTHQ